MITTSPDPLFKPEDVINDRYRVVRFMASGDISETYEAYDLRMYDVCHVVVVGREGIPSQVYESLRGAAQRCSMLVKRLSRLGPCGLAPILDVGLVSSTQKIPFYVMGKSETATLAEALSACRERGVPLAVSDALCIAGTIARTLAHVHAERFSYGDLTPQNVFMHGPDGMPSASLICTFDSFRHADEPAEAYFHGVPRYTAPEQFNFMPTGFASDVFSFGVVLYEMLTLRGPWDTHERVRSWEEWAAVHRHAAPTPARSVRPEISAEIEALLMSMLQKNPERRPTMRDVYAKLVECIGTPSVAALN